MTQHVVNVAFDFDDQKVREILEQSAVEDVENKLLEEIKEAIRGEGYYRASEKEAMKYMVERQIDRFLEENRDTIIEVVVKKLYERISRVKKVRNVKDAVEENETSEE